MYIMYEAKIRENTPRTIRRVTWNLRSNGNGMHWHLRTLSNYSKETLLPFDLHCKKKHRYLLTYIDHFTRYPEAIPISNQES